MTLSSNEVMVRLHKKLFYFFDPAIPASSEKMISISYGSYRILDSYSFLPASLDKLSRSLLQEKKNKKERLNFLAESQVTKLNGQIDTELYTLNTKKLCFPFQLANTGKGG